MLLTISPHYTLLEMETGQRHHFSHLEDVLLRAGEREGAYQLFHSRSRSPVAVIDVEPELVRLETMRQEKQR